MRAALFRTAPIAGSRTGRMPDFRTARKPDSLTRKPDRLTRRQDSLTADEEPTTRATAVTESRGRVRRGGRDYSARARRGRERKARVRQGPARSDRPAG
ncbi:hypothetical protein DY218_27835 [Streptomyces triticagri]|uniref:Uncharacterized protein n=1 Tax=Streptomyces triticagri TaxID=2293568 RepID=A0A372LY04_9ACTN|nr:hypothetical protein DY218_27835 [Streptomyces triticagri]